MSEMRKCEKRKWAHFFFFFKWNFLSSSTFLQPIQSAASKLFLLLNMKGGENKITARNEFVHLLLQCFMLKTFLTTFLLLLFMVLFVFFFSFVIYSMQNQGSKWNTEGKKTNIETTHSEAIEWNGSVSCKMNENKTESELQLKLRELVSECG